MSRWIAAIVAACMLFSITPVLAAGTGIVRGVVTEAGKPQSGAAVTLVGEGQQFSTTTGSNGAYTFATVPFGRYRLTVDATGASKHTVDVDVSSDAIATVNVEMLKTIVVTSSRAGAGVTGNPVAVTTIDSAQIQSSPDRDSLNKMIETVPGIVQFSYNEPVANGFHGITYDIDGAPLPLATTSNFAEIVDPKDVNSIEVFTGAIPAEYGGDRMGAVVNILTDRFVNMPEGTYGTMTGGIGNQSQAAGEFDTESRFGNNEIFLALNNQSTDRGIDAPTDQPIHDAASSSDEFLRWVSKLGENSTLAFDYSNQFSQYQIPINTDPNNPSDPIFSIPSTDDTQLEYDRFANLNFTSVSKDGNSVFQLIPWYRSTRVDYDGDLAADVQGLGPNFGCPNYPDCEGATPPAPNDVNAVGLQSATYANYLGVRVSELHSWSNNTWKIGIDANRENSLGSQTYACAYAKCAIPTPGEAPDSPYYSATANQAQPGSQFGAYIEDNYQANKQVAFNLGVRYDHSSGYVGGDMVEPRLGINVSDPDNRNVAHVFYGRYYAAPLLEDVRQACEIFSAQNGCASQTTGAAVTNPVYDLKPENDAYFEIGLQHNFNSSLTGWVNYFTKNVVNVLDTTQLLNTPLFAVYNNALGYNQGFEFRLQDNTPRGNDWFGTLTVSNSYAGGISGSTFLFPPGTNPPGVPIASPELLSPEDHSQTFDGTAGYTEHFGVERAWYATLQANYGSGFPVQFEDANINLSGTLPAHTTFDFSGGRIVLAGKGAQGLGVTLDVQNLLNHQYVIKVANGFNTTQIANSRTFLLRLTQPF